LRDYTGGTGVRSGLPLSDAAGLTESRPIPFRSGTGTIVLRSRPAFGLDLLRAFSPGQTQDNQMFLGQNTDMFRTVAFHQP